MTGLVPVAGAVLALTFLLGPPASADPALPPTVPAVPASDRKALAMLEQAAKAARSTAYEGVQFVSRWSPDGTTSMLVDIQHLPQDGTLMRVRGTSTEPGGEVFTASGGQSAGLSDTSGGPVELLARNYAVMTVGTGSVAGRRAVIVESRRRDASLAGRFWLDRQTGLMLRREVFDSRGATVRASAFIDISLGNPSFTGHLPPMLPEPWRARVAASDLTGLRAAGWECPDRLPAELARYDVRRADDGAGPVLHSSYSDGLSSVSLFEQKGRLDIRSLDGHREERRGDTTVYVKDGLQQSVVWSAHGTVYTVLADAPQETVQAVVAALPHEKVESGVVARMKRGFERVASWMNPFG